MKDETILKVVKHRNELLIEALGREKFDAINLKAYKDVTGESFKGDPGACKVGPHCGMACHTLRICGPIYPCVS